MSINWSAAATARPAVSNYFGAISLSAIKKGALTRPSVGAIVLLVTGDDKLRIGIYAAFADVDANVLFFFRDTNANRGFDNEPR